MAKRKPADAKQDNGAKKPRKPRIKKPAKLPEPLTQEELDASYRAIPAADLEPVETLGRWNGKLGTEDCEQPTQHGKAEPSEQAPFPSSAPRTTEGETRSQPGNIDANPNITREDRTRAEDNPDSGQEQSTTQTETADSEQVTGDELLSVAETASLYEETQPVILVALARDGEGRAACWERLRKEARTAGMPRGQGPGTAYEWATRETERLFPPPPPKPAVVEEPPAVEPEPEMSTIVDIEPEPVEVAPAPVPASDALDFVVPAHWPELPDNASLQVEIAWVSANRLRVRSGNGVDLSKAKTPAPSYSALSWLETSILFPSKFADISVKATANQDDEKEHIRREKLAIEEIRGLLAEMLED